MKDFEFNAVRDYCKPIAKKWLQLCGASWDHVQLRWQDSYFDEEVDKHPREAAAYCEADWRYLHATITFSCARLNDHFTDGKPDDPDFVEYVIVHEIMHIMLNETREWMRGAEVGIGHEERTATRLARAFQFTWRQAFEAGKRSAVKESKKGRK